jgi:hypothetical protein
VAALVNTVMKLRAPWNLGNVFTSWATVPNGVRYARVNKRMNTGSGIWSWSPTLPYYLQCTVPSVNSSSSSVLYQSRRDTQVGVATKQTGGGKYVFFAESWQYRQSCSKTLYCVELSTSEIKEAVQEILSVKSQRNATQEVFRRNYIHVTGC